MHIAFPPRKKPQKYCIHLAVVFSREGARQLHEKRIKPPWRAEGWGNICREGCGTSLWFLAIFSRGGWEVNGLCLNGGFLNYNKLVYSYKYYNYDLQNLTICLSFAILSYNSDLKWELKSTYYSGQKIQKVQMKNIKKKYHISINYVVMFCFSHIPGNCRICLI